MIPEIWSTADIIFCHSGPCFALLPPYGPRKSQFSKKWKRHLKMLSFYKHKWLSYDIWFLRYGVQQIEFFVILDHFLLFYPPNNFKNQNFEKMKQLPGDITILHRCTINDNHKMYVSWDMQHVTDKMFCHFGPVFALLPP